jgi:hypothetical protein
VDPFYLHPRSVSSAEKEDRVKPGWLARRENQRLLHEILGAPVFFDTTLFLAPHGEWIGECFLGTRKLMWSIWAPHKRVAIDIFPRQTPPPEELEHKEAFCAAHGIRYLVVPPTHSFDLEDLRAALMREPDAEEVTA